MTQISLYNISTIMAISDSKLLSLSIIQDQPNKEQYTDHSKEEALQKNDAPQKTTNMWPIHECNKQH